MLAKLGGRIDAVFFCPHVPEDECECRKPLTGLFDDIAKRYGVDLRTTLSLGESLRDVQAGASAGCEPHMVLTGKGAVAHSTEAVLVQAQIPNAVVHADLAAFADFVIRREREAKGLSADSDSSHGALR